MKTPIDLELKHEGYGEYPASPAKEKHYPSFHYEGSKDLGLPDEGEMTIKFRKVSSNHSENKDGKHSYSCTIDVREICEIEGEEADEPKSKVEDILDELMSKLSKAEKD